MQQESVVNDRRLFNILKGLGCQKACTHIRNYCPKFMSLILRSFSENLEISEIQNYLDLTEFTTEVEDGYHHDLWNLKLICTFIYRNKIADDVIEAMFRAYSYRETIPYDRIKFYTIFGDRVDLAKLQELAELHIEVIVNIHDIAKEIGYKEETIEPVSDNIKLYSDKDIIRAVNNLPQSMLQVDPSVIAELILENLK